MPLALIMLCKYHQYFSKTKKNQKKSFGSKTVIDIQQNFEKSKF